MRLTHPACATDREKGFARMDRQKETDAEKEIGQPFPIHPNFVRNGKETDTEKETGPAAPSAGRTGFTTLPPSVTAVLRRRPRAKESFGNLPSRLGGQDAASARKQA